MLWVVPFLALVGVLLPLMAVASARGTQDVQQLPSRTAIYIQLLVVQGLVGGSAALAVYGVDVPIEWGARLEAGTIGPAVGVVAFTLLVATVLSRSGASNDDLVRLLSPKSGSDWLMWSAAMLAAAVVEEFAYRGVLTDLGARVMDPWLAAGVSAFLFGLGHASQGWIGFVASAVFAIVMQWLVHHSGGLFLAIAAHLAYDVIAQLLARRLIRESCSVAKSHHVAGVSATVASSDSDSRGLDGFVRIAASR